MKKNIIYVIGLLVILFYAVKKNATFHAKFQHSNHTAIFLFVSNVKNFKLLNPTINNITHWERINGTSFLVKYTEQLSQISCITNYGHGIYSTMKEEDGSLSLQSQHLTCFLAEFLCLSTDSKLQIFKISKFEVGYREEIYYSCPFVLSNFCFNEIAIQREHIISKLREIFSGNPSIL